MAIPTKEEFLDSMYARLQDAQKLVREARQTRDVEQERAALKLVAEWRKLVIQAGGNPEA